VSSNTNLGQSVELGALRRSERLSGGGLERRFHGQTFMARWSRRKRASAQEGESAEPSAPADDAAAEAVEHALAAAAADARPSDAPASHEDARPVPQLPSIESIVAESDVRAFLAPGVPPELTRAALRRAWSTRYRCNLHSRIVIKKKSAQ
jgi:hypothetical protein